MFLTLIYIWMFLILVSAAIWRTIPPFKNMISPFSSRWGPSLRKAAEEELPEIQLLTEQQTPVFFAGVTLISWISSPVITVRSIGRSIREYLHQRKTAKFTQELSIFIEYLEETSRQYREEREYVTSREIASVLKEFIDRFESRWDIYFENEEMTFDECVTAIMQDLMAAAKGKIKLSPMPFPR